jgi:hypothetical protein
MRNRNLRFYIETGRLRYSIDKPRQTAFVTAPAASVPNVVMSKAEDE